MPTVYACEFLVAFIWCLCKKYERLKIPRQNEHVWAYILYFSRLSAYHRVAKAHLPFVIGVSLTTGVVIGFEEREYTVDSSTSGQALVGVSVLSGALSRSLEITFQTVDGTATGESLLRMSLHFH